MGKTRALGHPVIVAVCMLLLAEGRAFSQQAGSTLPADEKKLFGKFNWYEIMALDPADAFDALKTFAVLYTSAQYDRKEIFQLLLSIYSQGRELEKAHPFSADLDARAKNYRIDYGRQFSEYLDMPWKMPVVWTLYEEYFHYYVLLKSSG